MSSLAYLNGRLLPAAEAHIGIFDGGFLHGAGLFETPRAENGKVFQWEAHVGRLLGSAEHFGLSLRRGDLPTANVVETLLARNGLRSARLRLTVTVGDATRMTQTTTHEMESSTDPGAAAREGPRTVPTVCLTADALTAYPEDLYDRGLSVTISRRLQSAFDPLVGHKTTCYLPRLLALREAQRARCGEAIFFDEDHHLAEGAISNVFIVRKDAVLTPPLSTPVLPGTARALVLHLAREEGLASGDDEPLTINDLLDADEVFLTNALMQVMPVGRVEKREIGTGRAGPVARKLLEAYRGVVGRECGGGINVDKESGNGHGRR